MKIFGELKKGCIFAVRFFGKFIFIHGLVVQSRKTVPQERCFSRIHEVQTFQRNGNFGIWSDYLPRNY
jgi:hypothetical protein